MDYRFKKCLEERKLVKVEIDSRRIQKEFDSAVYDLKMANGSLEKKISNGQL